MRDETHVNERPILFSGEMVKAILDGRKTQTRRIVKPQPSRHHWETIPGYELRVIGPHPIQGGRVGVRFSHRIPQNQNDDGVLWSVCPHGSPGDRLWVRETWSQQGGLLLYRADGDRGNWDVWKWSPSIHMPRWASRITLEILRVRVERLCDISPDDCRAEGLPADNTDIGVRYGFGILWESIHGPGSWCLNPWVWVIEFKRI